MIHIHVHKTGVGDGSVNHCAHLSSGQVAEVTSTGPAESSFAVVDIDTHRIRPLIGTNKIRMPVPIYIGGSD